MRAFRAFALASLVLLMGCGPVVVATETRTRTVAHLPNAALVVRTGNGAIDVEASAAVSEVRIEATIACGGRNAAEAQSRLDAAVLSATRAAGGTLTVRADCPDPARSGDGAEVTVRLPDVLDADLSTSNGPVDVQGLAGLLTARTSNGAISVVAQDGDADLETSNGAITVQQHHGALAANTSNGPIDVALADDSPGPINLDTSNGRIDAEVGAGFTGRVTFDTSNGTLTVNDSFGRVTESSLGQSAGYVIVETGGSTSRLTTSNGSIRLSIR